MTTLLANTLIIAAISSLILSAAAVLGAIANWINARARLMDLQHQVQQLQQQTTVLQAVQQAQPTQPVQPTILTLPVQSPAQQQHDVPTRPLR